MVGRTALSRRAAWLREHASAVPPRAILVVGFVVLVLYAFPGFMSTDSVIQLHQARTGAYNNAHPPLMAFLWGLLDAIVAGPLLMLLAQVALFLGGLYGVLRQVLAPRPAAITAVAILWFPPIAAIMAVVWKDCQMAAYLMAGFALLLSPRRRLRLGGLALITAACAFRHNAFAASVPLVGLVFEWQPGARWWKRYLIAGAAAVATFLAATAINRALVVDEVHLTPAYTDIVGVLAFSEARTDEDLRHVLRDTPLRVTEGIHATARRLYDPRNSFHLTRGDQRMFDDATTPLHRAALARAWKELIVGDPHAYLSHRVAVFQELVGLSERGLWSPAFFGFVEHHTQAAWIGHDATPSTLQLEIHARFLRLIDETALFEAWMYGVLAVVFLLALARDRLSFTLLVSGLLYELSFFPTAGTPDCRYSHWMITCTVVAGVIIFVRRLERGRAARTGP